MVSSHVSSGRVPSVEEGNLGERVLLTPTQCSPRVHYGCTLEQALGGSGGAQAEQLRQLVRLYSSERYMLTWHSGAAWVLVLEGAQCTDLLRAMWQAAWLDRQHQWLQQTSGSDMHSSNGGSGGGGASNAGLLADSLAALQDHWPDFVRQAEQQGWQLQKAVLPSGTARLRLE
jgi:hypothetical protein